MKYIWTLLATCLVSSAILAEDYDAKAQAALSAAVNNLKKFDLVPAKKADYCKAYADARRQALKEGKVLVVWVNCWDSVVVDELGECIHVKVEYFPGAKDHDVIVGRPAGDDLNRFDIGINGISSNKVRSAGASKLLEQPKNVVPAYTTPTFDGSCQGGSCTVPSFPAFQVIPQTSVYYPPMFNPGFSAGMSFRGPFGGGFSAGFGGCAGGG